MTRGGARRARRATVAARAVTLVVFLCRRCCCGGRQFPPSRALLWNHVVGFAVVLLGVLVVLGGPFTSEVGASEGMAARPGEQSPRTCSAPARASLGLAAAATLALEYRRCRRRWASLSRRQRDSIGALAQCAGGAPLLEAARLLASHARVIYTAAGRE